MITYDEAYGIYTKATYFVSYLCMFLAIATLIVVAKAKTDLSAHILMKLVPSALSLIGIFVQIQADALLTQISALDTSMQLTVDITGAELRAHEDEKQMLMRRSALPEQMREMHDTIVTFFKVLASESTLAKDMRTGSTRVLEMASPAKETVAVENSSVAVRV